jgi:hypothetical protein
MEGRADIEYCKKLFGKNFIGVDELAMIASELGIQLPMIVPEIPYTKTELKSHSADCLLILGSEKMHDGSFLTLKSLRNRFGTKQDVSEPCFYNQDWYMKEDFIKIGLKIKWYLIRINIYEDSRSVLPEILEKKYKFPMAVLCAYVFFAYWFYTKTILWKYDFVWCSDIDHNGDKIYVGKYIDIDGINKNGFSIHRHLALRNFYGSISLY